VPVSSLVLALTLAWIAVTCAVQPKPFDSAQVRPGQREGPAGSPLEGARQVLLVLTDGWDAVSGTLQRFDRSSADGPWQAVGPAVPVVVGRSGLAWGSGVAPVQAPGPVKREGDGKSPAGVFRLSTAFGQTPDKPSAWQLPYRSLGDDVECVDDVRSASYNRLTTRSAAARVDWSSSEKMWQEPLYKWGVVVDHNASSQVQPAGGSCIFLHIWRGPGRGTAGCTATEESALTAVIAWLAPKPAPLLVQLPRAEYERLKSAWRLP
jgi:L,D-peptidoglycan transpeptidase YkuD (ErfK/YbiS/YcfS/YnhG family)